MASVNHPVMAKMCFAWSILLSVVILPTVKRELGWVIMFVAGMVQAWVAQKLVKRDILRVFTMSLFRSGTPIPREPRHFRSCLL
jgi:hypothetical protein